MKSPHRVGTLLALSSLLLTGCGAAAASTSAGPTDQPRSASAQHGAATGHSTPGHTSSGHHMSSMSSQGGHDMEGMATDDNTAATGHRAPPAVLMVCGPEIRSAVSTIVGRDDLPAPRSEWLHSHHFVCTYELPGGPLVLTVHVPQNADDGRAWFRQVRSSFAHTEKLPGILGLGLPAFESRVGVVAFLKDGMTLEVDARALPDIVGPHKTERTDFAYTIATDVLACWTEH